MSPSFSYLTHRPQRVTSPKCPHAPSPFIFLPYGLLTTRIRQRKCSHWIAPINSYLFLNAPNVPSRRGILVAFEPSSAGIQIKVLTRIHRRIHVFFDPRCQSEAVGSQAETLARLYQLRSGERGGGEKGRSGVKQKPWYVFTNWGLKKEGEGLGEVWSQAETLMRLHRLRSGERGEGRRGGLESRRNNYASSPIEV